LNATYENAPEVRCLLFVQFAVLLALVFAKIARIDYPRYWPSLVDDLLAVTAEGDGLRRRRAYLVLHHVLKELSSKRLSADQRTFAEVGLLPHPYSHRHVSRLAVSGIACGARGHAQLIRPSCFFPAPRDEQLATSLGRTQE
jgi:hypothetical protein